MAMLEIRNLEVYYGMIQAIKGISFDVKEGEVIALIGANGAGKTTTLHTITGQKRGRSLSKGRILRRFPAIRLFLREWRMSRRGGEYLPSFPFFRTFVWELIRERIKMK